MVMVTEEPWITEDASGGLVEIGPGVNGYLFDLGEQGLYIPFIEAQNPGSGDVARYLDNLPRDRRIVFPTVLSPRLLGMLKRRGFTDGYEWAEEFGEHCHIWERRPTDAD
jgi:hypothetical protein